MKRNRIEKYTYTTKLVRSTLRWKCIMTVWVRRVFCSEKHREKTWASRMRQKGFVEKKNQMLRKSKIRASSSKSKQMIRQKMWHEGTEISWRPGDKEELLEAAGNNPHGWDVPYHWRCERPNNLVTTVGEDRGDDLTPSSGRVTPSSPHLRTDKTSCNINSVPSNHCADEGLDEVSLRHGKVQKDGRKPTPVIRSDGFY